MTDRDVTPQSQLRFCWFSDFVLSGRSSMLIMWLEVWHVTLQRSRFTTFFHPSIFSLGPAMASLQGGSRLLQAAVRLHSKRLPRVVSPYPTWSRLKVIYLWYTSIFSLQLTVHFSRENKKSLIMYPWYWHVQSTIIFVPFQMSTYLIICGFRLYPILPACIW